MYGRAFGSPGGPLSVQHPTISFSLTSVSAARCALAPSMANQSQQA